jgi:hypothetical protein
MIEGHRKQKEEEVDDGDREGRAREDPKADEEGENLDEGKEEEKMEEEYQEVQHLIDLAKKGKDPTTTEQGTTLRKQGSKLSPE